jgi:hypothetical protein
MPYDAGWVAFALRVRNENRGPERMDRSQSTAVLAAAIMEPRAKVRKWRLTELWRRQNYVRPLGYAGHAARVPRSATLAFCGHSIPRHQAVYTGAAELIEMRVNYLI